MSRARRPERIRALMWVLPLLAFITLTFVVPIFSMLLRSVQNPHVIDVLHHTVPLLLEWDEAGGRLPEERVFAALAEDFTQNSPRRTIGSAGRRLDYEKRGLMTLFRKTAMSTDRLEPPYKGAFMQIHEGWGDIDNWRVIKRESRAYTPAYYVAALDHGYGVRTTYGHTKELLVKRGQRVERGDVIATLGNSGRSTGPHLHYVVEVSGKAKNPLDYIFD